MTTDSTGLASENSEVSPVAAFVAVAVTVCPAGIAFANPSKLLALTALSPSKKATRY